MATPTSNEGSTFFNINQCVSFNQSINASINKLSAFPCSQVTIWNHTGALLTLSACNCDQPCNIIKVPARAASTPLQPVVIMGLTNSDQISAGIPIGSPGLIYCRAEFFSSNPAD